MSIILLSSDGANTLVKLIDGAPDFSQYSEPTLSILQAGYEAGHYRTVPDVELIDFTSRPNWQGFYDQLIMSQIYNHLLTNTKPHPSISGAMMAMGFAINAGMGDPSNPDRLAALQAAVFAVLDALNDASIPLSVEQVAEVRELLDSNDFEMIRLQ
jgi:hypothetical protein